MVNVESVAHSLVDEKATVVAVAAMIGRVAEQRGAYFKIDVDDPYVESAHIGMEAGGGSASAPAYAELYFRDAHPVALSEEVPFCKEWKLKPTNARASPWHYSCPYSGSTASIKVVLFASLTDELGHPGAHVRTLLLQRNDWR